MNMLRATLRRRRSAVVGLALVLVAGALTLLLPSDSLAIPCGYEIRYYSSPSYVTVIGAYGHYVDFCGCGTYSWGSTSAYSRGRSVNYCDPA